MHVVPYIEEATPMILEIGVPGKDKKYVLTSRTSERCAFSGEMSSGLKNLLTLSLVDSGSASLYDVENQAHVASCMCMFLSIFSIPFHI